MTATATTLLVKSADVVVTMDAMRHEIRGGSVFVRGDAIETVGTDADVAAWIAAEPVARAPVRTISARGCVILPGLVNCHHHLFQSLTRTIGTGRGLGLFDWLKKLYPIWAELNPDAVYVSARLALCELVLSGAPVEFVQPQVAERCVRLCQRVVQPECVEHDRLGECKRIARWQVVVIELRQMGIGETRVRRCVARIAVDRLLKIPDALLE